MKFPCLLCAAKSEQSPPRLSSTSLSARSTKPRPTPMALPPIPSPDEGDLVSIRRKNNTMAARKSRQRQIDNLERLEAKIKQLSAERTHWKNWTDYIQANIRPGLLFPPWIPGDKIPVDPTEELRAMAR